MIDANVLVLLISCICSWLLLAVIVPHLGRLPLDLPNERSSHCRPTPRGGGVAFVLLASIASLVSLMSGPSSASEHLLLSVAALLAMPLGFVGFLDDRFDLPSSWRYGAQLATAFVVSITSPLLSQSSLFLPLLVFWFDHCPMSIAN